MNNAVNRTKPAGILTIFVASIVILSAADVSFAGRATGKAKKEAAKQHTKNVSLSLSAKSTPHGPPINVYKNSVLKAAILRPAPGPTSKASSLTLRLTHVATSTGKETHKDTAFKPGSGLKIDLNPHEHLSFKNLNLRAIHEGPGDFGTEFHSTILGLPNRTFRERLTLALGGVQLDNISVTFYRTSAQTGEGQQIERVGIKLRGGDVVNHKSGIRQNILKSFLNAAERRYVQESIGSQLPAKFRQNGRKFWLHPKLTLSVDSEMKLVEVEVFSHRDRIWKSSDDIGLLAPFYGYNANQSFIQPSDN